MVLKEKKIPPPKHTNENCITKRAVNEMNSDDIDPIVIMRVISENINSVGLQKFKDCLFSGVCSHCVSCKTAWILVQAIHKKNLE